MDYASFAVDVIDTDLIASTLPYKFEVDINGEPTFNLNGNAVFTTNGCGFYKYSKDLVCSNVGYTYVYTYSYIACAVLDNYVFCRADTYVDIYNNDLTAINRISYDDFISPYMQICAGTIGNYVLFAGGENRNNELCPTVDVYTV